MRIEGDTNGNDKKSRKFGFAYSRGNLSQRALEVNADFLNKHLFLRLIVLL